MLMQNGIYVTVKFIADSSSSFQLADFPARADFLFVGEFAAIRLHAKAFIEFGRVGKAVGIGVRNYAAKAIFPESVKGCEHQSPGHTAFAISRADEYTADAPHVTPFDEFGVDHIHNSLCIEKSVKGEDGIS